MLHRPDRCREVLLSHTLVAAVRRVEDRLDMRLARRSASTGAHLFALLETPSLARAGQHFLAQGLQVSLWLTLLHETFNLKVKLSEHVVLLIQTIDSLDIPNNPGSVGTSRGMHL